MRFSLLFDLFGASISAEPKIILRLLFFFKKSGISSDSEPKFYLY